MGSRREAAGPCVGSPMGAAEGSLAQSGSGLEQLPRGYPGVPAGCNVGGSRTPEFVTLHTNSSSLWMPFTPYLSTQGILPSSIGRARSGDDVRLVVAQVVLYMGG